MKSSQQVLTAQLTTAVAPHIGPAGAVPASKAVAKTLRQLSGQLLKQQARQVKADARAARPTKKMVRQQLAGELTNLLQPLLGGPEEAAKAVRKSVLQLAGLVLKQRRRQQDKPAAKAARKPATRVAVPTAAATPKAEAKATSARPAPRQALAPKRPAVKPRPAPVATIGSMAVAAPE
ncbi:hypothetical protein LGH70_09960 [Hymenobacter sp. BT635]|uniref:Uncharacterized protein n=1 Tax=Hymenobacter nitidus TaxID=2880929 RepID=A0ABS8ADW4_9BACT|nr:hypothetical protein [Hymenobacter nitidus]MCB2377907.1 hypothetical protein [Hymenobacter nitidus]